MKLKRFGLAFLACMLIVCSLTSAFAATGFEEGPSAWLEGSNNDIFGGIIVATATGNSLSVGGKARFKLQTTVSPREARVAIALVDCDHGDHLGSAIKTSIIQGTEGQITGYYTIGPSPRIDYTKGQRCQYVAVRTGIPNGVWGQYIGYLTTDIAQ